MRGVRDIEACQGIYVSKELLEETYLNETVMRTRKK
jgi:hypothetical protein